jgi:hypothetical protein
MLLKSHQSVMTFIKGWLNNLKILVCAPRSLTHAASVFRWRCGDASQHKTHRKIDASLIFIAKRFYIVFGRRGHDDGMHNISR